MPARDTKWLWTSVFAIAFLAFGERSIAQPCTTDAECDDGFSCTDDDHCDLGTNTCFFPRNDSLCDDGFSCTNADGCNPTSPSADANGCVFPKNDALCDDGFSCTDGDGCNPSSASADANGCVFPRNDALCDDGFSCTDGDGCNPSSASADSNGCVFPKNDAPCVDGDDCTTDIGCDPSNPSAQAGTGCLYEPILDCCEDDDDCPDDGFSCTLETCDLGTHTCQSTKDDSVCAAGPGGFDGFTCTIDACNPANAPPGSTTGCQTTKDDSVCTAGPGGFDGFTCTIDACNPSNAPPGSTTGCQTTKDDTVCTAGPGGADGFTCTDDACNPANAPPGSTTGCQTSRDDSKCDDGILCTGDECNPSDPGTEPGTGCLNPLGPGCCLSDADCPLDPNKCINSFCDLTDNACKEVASECRVSTSKKGSLLYYSKIELRWNAAGGLTQDTFLTIVNDYPSDVFVQWYFVNGDAPTAAVYAGSPPVLVERAHKGWNWVDCTTHLTEDESGYMAMSKGLPLGCQPFGILDPGVPAGRPDPDGPTGERVLRGYAVAFAVDNQGKEISWNHLSGSVDIVNYANRSAWEYNSFAFQCVADVAQGDACELVGRAPAGILKMDGLEYDYAFDKLLFDFYAVGSLEFSQRPVNFIRLDTDLTLYPVSADLRQDSDGPVLTKAKFDIWNENEDGLSGTYRCISCWDQTLLSKYDAPNNFLIANLQTNKGKARIDGMQSDVCHTPDMCCNLGVDRACFPAIDHPTPDKECSQNAAILGVSDKILHFSGLGGTGRTDAGMTLVGQGQEAATFMRDIIAPPEPLIIGDRGEDELNFEAATPAPIRAIDRELRRVVPGKN